MEAAAAARWPDLRQSLGKSAVLLRTTQQQLRHALAHRKQYEAAMRQTLDLTRLFADALPVLTEQLEGGLQQQEDSRTGWRRPGRWQSAGKTPTGRSPPRASR